MKVLKCLKALTSENRFFTTGNIRVTVDVDEQRGSTMLCVFVLAFAPYYTTARVIKQGKSQSAEFLWRGSLYRRHFGTLAEADRHKGL